VKVQYTGHLGYRLVHLVVDDHERGELPAQAHLLGPQGDAPVHLVVVIAPLAQTRPLDLGGRGHEQDDQCVRMSHLHLARPLEVDLEDHVLAGRGVGKWRAVQVAEELRPLQESAAGDLLLETPAIDECVRVGGFTGAARTRGPGAAEPQPGITLQEAGDDGALPRPAGAGDDEDQDFEVCVSRASR